LQYTFKYATYFLCVNKRIYISLYKAVLLQQTDRSSKILGSKVRTFSFDITKKIASKILDIVNDWTISEEQASVGALC